ncbi:MAG: hypothetical protein ACJAZN_000806 [Planctomycetota bacterium]|jgi:hypothetical protein
MNMNIHLPICWQHRHELGGGEVRAVDHAAFSVEPARQSVESLHPCMHRKTRGRNRLGDGDTCVRGGLSAEKDSLRLLQVMEHMPNRHPRTAWDLAADTVEKTLFDRTVEGSCPLKSCARLFDAASRNPQFTQLFDEGAIARA